jgi:carbonic anhydrase
MYKCTHTLLVGIAAGLVFMWAGIGAAAKDAVNASISPEVALAKLNAGNARFVARPMSEAKPTAQRRAETARAQHPFAIIVTCADSRTSPELVFDQNLGDLFVIRTAGNLIDDHGLGSIEYAVNHLGTRLIVVLGHERCGAVEAALASPTAPGHINSLVRDIQPAVKVAKTEKGDLLVNAVHANARLVAEKISKEADFGDHKGAVRVVTGYYDLDTGKIQWPAEKVHAKVNGDQSHN